MLARLLGEPWAGPVSARPAGRFFLISTKCLTPAMRRSSLAPTAPLACGTLQGGAPLCFANACACLIAVVLVT